ncbi:melatonin receptor type 1A [Nothoprocta perdicaria]|uniref:melatonin receptor type 1A n=1 Tax=Nothoprocta perdicaria TaxID=30464 RepID=UPI000E1BD004|nr:melatonin receptor type 1A [Nothoprocta perdicaria]
MLLRGCSERPQQAGEWSRDWAEKNFMMFNIEKCKILNLERNHLLQAGGELCREGPGSPSRQDEEETGMCPCSKGSQQPLGLHYEYHGQKAEMGNVFVVSLAIADLVVAIYPYPLVLTSVFHNGWNLGYLHCQISGFLMGLSVIGSIFNITGIAINRYCYICHSLKYDRLYSDKNSLCYVVLIWVLTFVAIVPNLFVGSLQYDPRIYSCTFAQSVSSAYTIAVVFFHFMLPIAIVTFCYLRIWILVIQVRRRVKPDNNPKLKPHDFRNFVTMFVVFVLFAVCWAPLNFIGLAVAVNPETIIPRIPEWLFVSSYYMAYFNSCLNAIIYGLLNQNFRREYKRIIITFCTAKVFFQDSSNEAADRMRSKPSPLITNNNQVKVDSV